MKVKGLFGSLFGPEKAPLALEPIEMEAASAKSSGGGALPPPEEPKVKKGQASIPSFLKSATPPEGALPRLDRGLINTDITTLRSGQGTWAVVRSFVAANPDLSAAVFAYLRAALTSGYVAVAKNRDGTFNKEATALLQQLISRFDVLGDYKDGFSGVGSLLSVSESIAKEFIVYGAGSLELVLDKARLPRELAPVSVTTVQFKSDGKELLPFQKLGSDEVDLDIPTFFYGALDQDLLEPYAASPLESSLQSVLFAHEFHNDLRRIVKKAIHPRVEVVIDQEKFAEILPAEAQHDPEKKRAFMNTFIAEIQTMMSGLQPEDAVVYFDSLKIGYIAAGGGNTNHDAVIEALQSLIDAKVATGAKTMPSILGHGSGSQNIASVETMLFMKSAAGAIQLKLNELYSRALTLAVRLFGLDVVVIFKYDSIDLRPEAELEAFRSMRQDRLLEQLSLGFISDEEASLLLTGALPPPTFKPLSGTGFHEKKPLSGDENGHTNQSTGGAGGGAGQQRDNDTPKEKRGASRTK